MSVERFLDVERTPANRAPQPTLSSDQRRSALGYRGATMWLTGLPAAGKTTLSCELERSLVARGRPAYRLDGDAVRAELCCDLGFGWADRAENVRRAALVARWLADAGVVAIVALVSPSADARAVARATHEKAGIVFVEVHVATPLWICERRDPKGLYRRARRGELAGMTGVDDPYEPPADPDIRLGGGAVSSGVDAMLRELAKRGVVTT